MKHQQMFLTKYVISAHDGEVEHHIFSSLEKAVDFCSKSREVFIDNPLIEGCGWLIEKHIIDIPKKEPVFYNAKGIQIYL